MNALGRPSAAAAIEPPLRSSADAGSAGYRADGGSTGWCVVRAATVTGVGHRLAGEVNQDYYAWAQSGTRLAIAVADGLGSLPGSDAAARMAACAAVHAAVDAAADAAADSDHDPHEAALEAIARAESAVRGGGESLGATTLIVAVAESGTGVALARVGDSTAMVVGPGTGAQGGCWREVFPPPPGEEALVEVATVALQPAGEPAADDAESADISLLEGEVLVLVSDGIAGPWRDGPSTVAPAMVEGILGIPSPLELAELANFSRQGCHDDRTVVAVWLGTPATDD